MVRPGKICRKEELIEGKEQLTLINNKSNLI